MIECLHGFPLAGDRCPVIDCPDFVDPALLIVLSVSEGRYSHRDDTPAPELGANAPSAHRHDTPALCELLPFPEPVATSAEGGFNGDGGDYAGHRTTFGWPDDGDEDFAPLELDARTL